MVLAGLEGPQSKEVGRFRGLGSRAEDTLSALNQYLESYFEEEMNRPGKPN